MRRACRARPPRIVILLLSLLQISRAPCLLADAGCLCNPLRRFPSTSHQIIVNKPPFSRLPPPLPHPFPTIWIPSSQARIPIYFFLLSSASLIGIMIRPALSALAWASIVLLATARERRLCRQFQNQTSEDGMYNLGTNQWGADGSGGQCVTYDPEAEPEPGATAFTATWKWVEAINNVCLDQRPMAMQRD